MIKKLKLVDEATSNENKRKFHPEILTIIFEHRRFIKNIFLEINGIFDICHIGITIIDPCGETVIFSSTPNIEYNLISQNLWQNDYCFAPSMCKNKTLTWWDSDVEDVNIIKLQNNKFSLGMTISREINHFYLLYSYATKSKRDDLRTYYLDNTRGLIDIGDYFYKSILDIYSIYNSKHTPPDLRALITEVSGANSRSHLKLVANNSLIKRSLYGVK